MGKSRISSTRSSSIESPHFARNTAGISSVEFFWGMGMPILIESTFLQIFLRSLGASYFLIGLLPVFLGVSLPIFSLASAYVSARLKSKRTSVIIYHMAAAVPIMLFGLFLLVLHPEEGVLPLFLTAYVLFSIGIGFTLPSWQSFIISLFTHRDSLRALSVMFIVQSCAKLIGSFVIYRVVARFALSIEGAALVFTFGGSILFFGALLFFITREEQDPDWKPLPFEGIHGFVRSLREIIRIPDFRVFIGSDFSYFAVVTALSFYGNYAKEYGGVPEDLVAGVFVAVGYTGGIVMQILFGWLNFFTLRYKFVFSKLIGLAGVLLLIPGHSTFLFLCGAACLGAARALRTLIYPPAVKAIARAKDTTPHFALIALVEMPFSAGLPLLSGLFLDRFIGLEADSYRILFIFLALLISVGLYFALKLNFED
ncbi:MAG: MFS transporter [Sediminispirochaetaceae bacterium]